MATLAGFPYQEIEFHKDLGHNEAQESELQTMLDEHDITDLVIVSHGWNNDMDEARTLYQDLFTSMRTALDNGSGGGLPGRTIGILGILWPAKKFTERELIAGGAAAAGADDVLLDRLEELKNCFDLEDDAPLLERAKALVADLENKRTARNEFGDIVRQLMGDIVDVDEECRDEIPANFFAADGDEMLDLASRVREERRSNEEFGGAAGFGLRGIKAGALRLINFATYYQMKKRAGKIGEGPVHALLDRIKQAHPHLKLHLIGHSFGGRLVTAAARGADDQAPIVFDSMALLQAAFSHNGFAEKFSKKRDGYYRPVVSGKRVAGPIVVTYTENDTAVGIAYPLASKLSREDAAGLGDAGDRFGGIGRNGAQHTKEAVLGELLGLDGKYAFEGGSLYNLRADDFIANHGDVAGIEVAHAVVCAIAATGPN
jgi:hypothetical protein